jgi:hypothetical protein
MCFYLLFFFILEKGVQIDQALLRCLLCLRKKLVRRGRYLSALRDDIDIPIDIPIPINSLHPINVDDLYVNGSTDNLWGREFNIFHYITNILYEHN